MTMDAPPPPYFTVDPNRYQAQPIDKLTVQSPGYGSTNYARGPPEHQYGQPPQPVPCNHVTTETAVRLVAILKYAIKILKIPIKHL